jgi:class 3 adenylate cyclase/tetratricopeptide (TPR) repeat protein
LGVHCSVCDKENAEGARFCIHCGAPQQRRCVGCGTDLAAAARFCQQCGAAVAATPAAPGPGALSESAPTLAGGERRQLTVMFCDLVNSTEMATRFDPEDWHSIAAEYQRAGGAGVNRFGGYGAKYLGDGLLAFFGYPQAHEDDAERGVRAGLAILETIDARNSQVEAKHAVRLAVRVGLHTGPVVVATGGGDVPDVFGETPNVAARVQTAAEPDSVYITAATHRLVAGFFVVEDRGVHPLKGVRDSPVLYRVRQANVVRGSLHAAAHAELTPFVGREQERRLLIGRWEQAREGNGQVVLVTGEAGIGKSRLLQQFKGDLAGIPHTWAECGASPFAQNTPFAVTIDMLQHGLMLPTNASVEAQVELLERSLSMAGIDAAVAVPLLAPLLGLAVPAHYAPPLISPEQQRHRLIATLVDWVLRVGHLQPIVVVVEDLHWADPSSLEVIRLLAQQGATAPLLLLISARPEFRTPWPLRAHHTQIALNRLSRAQVCEMIKGVATRLFPASDVIETLVTRTDGVPLFVEELTRAVIEAEGRTPGAREIPPTLQDTLMARLDRLGPERELVQVGAVIGREFPYHLLQAVVGQTDTELQGALGRITSAELLYVRGVPPDATYLFKHMLLRDVAYDSLLKSRRRELHRAVARALEQQPEGGASLEALAHHHAEAGDVPAAVAARQQAGERAVDRFALAEAAAHFKEALGMLRTLPENPSRTQQELMLQVALGKVLQGTKGFASAEAVACFARARALGQQLGDAEPLVMVLVGMWAVIQCRAEAHAAQELADQMLQAAEAGAAPGALLWAHYAQGASRYGRGDLLAARKHLDVAISGADDHPHRGTDTNPKFSALVHRVFTSWQLGALDQARDQSRTFIEESRLKTPFDLGLALVTAIQLYVYLRDADVVLAYADELQRVAEEHQLAPFVAWATLGRGWAFAAQGRAEQGIPLLRQGLADYLATGQRTGLGNYLGWLAGAYLAAGDWSQGLAAVDDAMGATPEEEVHVPQFLWLRGDLLLASAGDGAAGAGGTSVDEARAAAERCYRDAIDLANRQGGKTQQLRAATRLGRLLQTQGRVDDARALVAPLYASFTEGFDTLDVRDAKSLLDELK